MKRLILVIPLIVVVLCVCGVAWGEESFVVLGTSERGEDIPNPSLELAIQDGLIKAVENASEFDIVVTDEAQAMEMFRKKVAVVDSSPDNIKLTYIADVDLAESLIRKYFGVINT